MIDVPFEVELSILFFCHFLADFPFQSNEMAINKSKSVKVLLHHVLIHFVVFTALCMPFFGWKAGLVLAGVNCFFHAIIDWNIWRGYKRLVVKKWPELSQDDLMKHGQARHWFFVTIGADQFLHAVSIFFAIWVAEEASFIFCVTGVLF